MLEGVCRGGLYRNAECLKRFFCYDVDRRSRVRMRRLCFLQVNPRTAVPLYFKDLTAFHVYYQLSLLGCDRSPVRSTSRCVLLRGSTDAPLRVTNSRTAPPRGSLTTPPPPPDAGCLSSPALSILHPFTPSFRRAIAALWPSPARRLSRPPPPCSPRAATHTGSYTHCDPPRLFN